MWTAVLLLLFGFLADPSRQEESLHKCYVGEKGQASPASCGPAAGLNYGHCWTRRTRDGEPLEMGCSVEGRLRFSRDADFCRRRRESGGSKDCDWLSGGDYVCCCVAYDPNEGVAPTPHCNWKNRLRWATMAAEAGVKSSSIKRGRREQENRSPKVEPFIGEGERRLPPNATPTSATTSTTKMTTQGARTMRASTRTSPMPTTVKEPSATMMTTAEESRAATTTTVDDDDEIQAKWFKIAALSFLVVLFMFVIIFVVVVCLLRKKKTPQTGKSAEDGEQKSKSGSAGGMTASRRSRWPPGKSAEKIEGAEKSKGRVSVKTVDKEKAEGSQKGAAADAIAASKSSPKKEEKAAAAPAEGVATGGREAKGAPAELREEELKEDEKTVQEATQSISDKFQRSKRREERRNLLASERTKSVSDQMSSTLKVTQPATTLDKIADLPNRGDVSYTGEASSSSSSSSRPTLD